MHNDSDELIQGLHSFQTLLLEFDDDGAEEDGHFKTEYMQRQQ